MVNPSTLRSDAKGMRTGQSRLARPSSLGVRLKIAITASALLVGFAPPIAEAASGYVFSGGGFGHSVGMSQFGAYGMSRAGYSWQEIMGHYFTGASPAPVERRLSNTPIWVNLTTEKASLSFTVTAVGPNPVPVTFTSTAGTVSAEPGQGVTVVRRADGTCRVTVPTGTLDGPCAIDGEWDGWNGSPSTAFVLDGCSLVNWNLPSGARLQPCTYARGGLRIRPDNNTNTVNLSLEIAMEDYLLGISEMPSFWGSTGGAAALQAQAVAARSYAYARVIQRGDPAGRPWCWCQLYDTTVDQNYVGWGHGTQEWLDAVASTEGQVMTHPSRTVDGVLVPIETYYSSSTFGWTEDSENGFSTAVPYLRSVDDHWGILPEVNNSNATWTRTIAPTNLASSLPGMASVTGAVITKCSTTGAALEVTFSGSGGPRTYKTRDLRSLLSLRSMQIVSISTPNGVSSCPGLAGGGAPTTTTVPETTTTTVPDTTSTTTSVPEASTTTTIPGTTTTTTAAIASDSCGVLAPKFLADLLGSNAVLSRGSRGVEVRQLELFLLAMGYSPITPDLTFGSQTAGAVRAFQDDRGLPIDGTVGSRTRGEIAIVASAAGPAARLAATDRLLAGGATGRDVRDLQKVLAALGFDPGPSDGVYGARTTAAVRSFQQAKQLLADGLFGALSRRALAEQFGVTGSSCR